MVGAELPLWLVVVVVLGPFQEWGVPERRQAEEADLVGVGGRQEGDPTYAVVRQTREAL